MGFGEKHPWGVIHCRKSPSSIQQERFLLCLGTCRFVTKDEKQGWAALQSS